MSVHTSPLLCVLCVCLYTLCVLCNVQVLFLVAARPCVHVHWDQPLGLCVRAVNCGTCMERIGVEILAGNKAETVLRYVNRVSSSPGNVSGVCNVYSPCGIHLPRLYLPALSSPLGESIQCAKMILCAQYSRIVIKYV